MSAINGVYINCLELEIFLFYIYFFNYLMDQVTVTQINYKLGSLQIGLMIIVLWIDESEKLEI